MSCQNLLKLVKAYTRGEIPLEVYREKRRQIVNEFTEDAVAKPPLRKQDPLDSFITSVPEKPFSKRKKLYLSAAALVAIFAIGISVLLFPSGKPGTSSPDQPPSLRLADQSQAQKLMDAFLRSGHWDKQNINQFILDWQILSPEERHKAKNTALFNHFTSSIQKRLNEKKNSTVETDRQSVNLMTSLLATVDPGHFLYGSANTQASTQAVEAVTPPSVETPEASPLTAGQEKEPVVIAEKEATETPSGRETKTAKQQAATRIPQKRAKATDSTVGEATLKIFVKRFESGNLDELMKLFSPNATTNHHTSADEISNSYAELFQTTSQRDLDFSHFSWKSTGKKLQGKGKYLAHLNPKGTNVEQIYTADVAITLDASKRPARIDGLYLTNQQFSTSLRQSVKAAVPEAQTLPPPNKEELRTLLENFVKAYNRGDIDDLMVLFSQGARTNDRSTINGIREDYEQLFQTTRSREITFNDINWKFTANNAVAKGLFEVKIKPKNSDPITIQGEIHIAATKFEGGVLITQLLHNTQ